MWIFSKSRGTDGQVRRGRRGDVLEERRRVAGPVDDRAADVEIATSCVTRARTCASGRKTNTTASEASSSRRSYMSIVARQLPWVSTQPFGGPVVPDV